MGPLNCPSYQIQVTRAKRPNTFLYRDFYVVPFNPDIPRRKSGKLGRVPRLEAMHLNAWAVQMQEKRGELQAPKGVHARYRRLTTRTRRHDEFVNHFVHVTRRLTWG